MHELSIAREIVRVVGTDIASHRNARVAAIDVVVGVYSGVDPSALEFAFPAAAEGTVCAGAELRIEAREPVYTCFDCGLSPVDPASLHCARCQSGNIGVSVGTELEIAAVELVEPDDMSVHDSEPQRCAHGENSG